MKLIKLNNIQAKKIAGMYGKYHAIDPVFIEEDFFLVPLAGDLDEIYYNTAITYLLKLSSQGKIKEIDTANKTDPDVIKLLAVKKETLDESSARIATRITKLDYTKVDIKDEIL